MSKHSSEVVVTDKFLDSLNIPQGKREERIAILRTQSELFSRFLSLHIGTAKIVKLRRLLINKFHNKINHPYSAQMEIIGSTSEGLDMSRSDIDYLFVANIPVHETGEQNNDAMFVVEYDSLMDIIHPGYVMLRNFVPSNELHTCLNVLNDILGIKNCTKLKQHGPAFMRSTRDVDYDQIFSLKSESWPKIAMEWIHRNRKFGWPSQEMIYSIVQKGCHIVPVGSSRNHAVDKDWRLSFCTAEKQLIETFNHTQILVYGVLKLILREIMNKPNVAELLCSYVMKTVMFWVIEDTSSSYWIPQNILLCFHLCLRRLIQFVNAMNCPSYFVKGNNLFRERFNTAEKKVLLQILCDIACHGWQWVLQTKTLERFSYFMTRQKLDIDILNHTVYKKEQLDIFKLTFDIIQLCRERTYYIMSKVIPMNKSFLSTICKVPVIRHKTISLVCHFIDTDNSNLGQKSLYTLRKLEMHLLTMESLDSIVSGKILLSSWLYTRGRYNESLQVTNAGLKNLDLCMFHEGKRIMKTGLFYNFLRTTRDFTEMLYLTSSNFEFPITSLIVPRELLEVFKGKKKNMCFQYGLTIAKYCSRSYIYFLRCLCYFRLGDTHRCEHEYNEMKSVCKTYCGQFENRHQASNFDLRLTCNRIRHNIDFDVSNRLEWERVLREHRKKFDFTTKECVDFLRNLNKCLNQAPVNVIEDFFKD
ncbi:uncharacterized protein LOC143054389 [Mytilus galloprovincialis]|uniref:uncharacterized protein LOC143054389 n=1 Tax=Mytilus galloprovincialis TaxID=29158 RepID=UPI003F7BC5D5